MAIAFGAHGRCTAQAQQQEAEPPGMAAIDSQNVFVHRRIVSAALLASFLPNIPSR
jgi:hypothetical protein